MAFVRFIRSDDGADPVVRIIGANSSRFLGGVRESHGVTVREIDR
jgi:hypothetical protein